MPDVVTRFVVAVNIKGNQKAYNGHMGQQFPKLCLKSVPHAEVDLLLKYYS